MSKTKTKTQDFQVKYWKSVTGWTVTNKKTEKVMASRKSSIPYTQHFKSTMFDRQLELKLCLNVSGHTTTD